MSKHPEGLEPEGIIHVYPQLWEHDGAFIVGTPSGLKTLRDILDRVIQSGEKQEYGMVFATDGEGYDLAVMQMPEEEIDKLTWHYQRLDYPADGKQHPAEVWDYSKQKEEREREKQERNRNKEQS